MRSVASSNLTIVSIAWRKQRRNHRLLFGSPREIVRLDWRRRLAVFETDQIFGYERWRANQYGTIVWQIFVIKAGGPGDRLNEVSGIQPGAEILLSAHGKAAAKRALDMFGVVSEFMPLDEVPEQLWRDISHRMQARMPIEPLFVEGAFRK